MPQFQGAGLTLRTITGAPVWVGELVVAVVVVANVAAGGMRSITFVQAFQYWVKLTAIMLPAIFLLLVWRADAEPALTGDTVPRFRETTTVSVQADVNVRVGELAIVKVQGQVDGLRYDGASVSLAPGMHTVRDGAELTFEAGAAVPVNAELATTTNAEWAQPLSGGREHSLYITYSLILATLLGTMGLPHVLVRFYTNPDGRAARRTTLVVLALLGAFYLAPAVFGALGRLYAPELLMTGRTDAVVLVLPEKDDRRPRRGAARRPRHGRRVRGVPVDGVRPDHVGRRRPVPGPLPRRHPHVPDRGRRRHRGAVRARRGGRRAVRRGRRQPRVLRGRLDVLSRCWCWGSGGGGCPRSARPRACSPAGSSPARPSSSRSWAGRAPAGPGRCWPTRPRSPCPPPSR